MNQRDRSYFFRNGRSFFVTKIIILFVGCFVFIFLGSTFAEELNSSNIALPPYNCPTSATDCDLSNMMITSIAPNTFINHENLTTLTFRNDLITSITSGTFVGLTNLLSLTLANNQINSIDSHDFAGLVNLTYLSLYNNQINLIDSHAFADLTHLTSLYLGNNKIFSINSGMFAGLANLQTLSLGNNRLTTIDTGTFSIFSGSLVSLYLSNNFLISLPQELTSLNSIYIDGLDISYNYLNYTGFNLQLINFIDNHHGIAYTPSRSPILWRDSQSLPFLSCATTDIPEAECEAVVHLYETTNGDNRNNHLKWIISNSICDWYGISCTDGHVTSITLENNNLSGFVSLSGLTELTSLDLADPSTDAGRPDNTLATVMLSGLANLDSLYLGSLNLSSVDLFGVENITTLTLGFNNLSTVDLSAVPKLEYLELQNNHISTIDLSHVPQLSYLDMRSNNLSNIDFSAVPNLYDLNLGDNHFTSIDFPALTQLASLTMYQNQLTSLDVSPLINLESIDVSQNQLTNIDISPLTNLVSIDVSQNQLSGINLSGLTHLSRVSLSHNLIPILDLPLAVGLTGFNAEENLLVSLPESTKDFLSLSESALNINCWNTGTMSTELINFLDEKAGNSDRQTSLNPLCPLISNDVDTSGSSIIPPSPPSQGGSSSMKKDACPAGDLSASYYDGICSASGYQSATCSISGSPYEEQVNDAYLWACNLGITTQPTIQQANLDSSIQRNFLAKMLSEFAIKVLGKTPDTSKSCNFDDMGSQSHEMKGYITLACQLGLMGYQGDGITKKDSFDTDGTLTRAEFGTILSRLIRGTKYANANPFYSKHLAALKEVNIMTVIENPILQEQKSRVMLMMYRVASYLK